MSGGKFNITSQYTSSASERYEKYDQDIVYSVNGGYLNVTSCDFSSVSGEDMRSKPKVLRPWRVEEILIIQLMILLW